MTYRVHAEAELVCKMPCQIQPSPALVGRWGRRRRYRGDDRGVTAIDHDSCDGGLDAKDVYQHRPIAAVVRMPVNIREEFSYGHVQFIGGLFRQPGRQRGTEHPSAHLTKRARVAHRVHVEQRQNSTTENRGPERGESST
jgi:hypothetical protein